MKLLTSSLVLIASALLAASQKSTPCNPDECPTPACANPKTVKDECCPSCEASSCKFKGCVNYGPFGAQWRPDSCTICRCAAGQKVCSNIECEKPQCFGFPTKVNPDSCCPVCDWGISDEDCRPIPVGKKSLYVAMGDDQQCQTDVLMHACDKSLIRKNGRLYRCKPRTRNHVAQMNKCRGVRKVVYLDVKECVLEEENDIPMDLNPSPNFCQFRF